MQCRNSRQNSSIISSILSEDTMLSSTSIRNIISEIVADIEIGPESSDETVPLSIVLNKGFRCVFLVTLYRRDESSAADYLLTYCDQLLVNNVSSDHYLIGWNNDILNKITNSTQSNSHHSILHFGFSLFT